MLIIDEYLVENRGEITADKLSGSNKRIHEQTDDNNC